ncbi:MAG: GGDEF domain-containing protein [Rhizobiaceae bacterium]
MRFHKSETAFFVFMTIIVMASGLTLYAHSLVRSMAGGELTFADPLELLGTLIFLCGVLLATSLFFGVFFIYPLIRTQVKEESKLRAMTATLSERSQTFEQAALTDALTGMQNRRYFDEALDEYLKEFARVRRPVGLMIIDLDHFKHVNDTHGHDVGDEVLRAVAECLKDLTRYHDVVARLGGEEFAVVAPNMNLDLLTRLAERIRKAIAAAPVSRDKSKLRVTASIGVAVWDGYEDAEGLFRRADQNLYEAKRGGRNRISA